MAVNNTAMFHVVRDTTKYLLSQYQDVALSACGVEVDVVEFAANDFQLTTQVKDRTNHRLHEAIEPASHPKARKRVINDTAVSIFFDPLYLLFDGLERHSVVFVLDLTPVTRPEWHNAKVAAAYKRAFKLLWAPNVTTVAISESTKRDLWANYGLPSELVEVVPLYNRLAAPGEPAPLGNLRNLLFVGSLEERKNIRGLIEGFRLSGLHGHGFSLIIVGGDGHGADAIRHAAHRVPRVVLRGRISDRDLRQEYASARAFVYPSYWEGFGLPVLEALGYGVPCLLSMTGALPEIGSRFALYCDPCDPLDIAQMLQSIVQAERPSLVGTDSSAGLENNGILGLQAHLAKFDRQRYFSDVSRILDVTWSKIPHLVSMDRSMALAESTVPASAADTKRNSFREFLHRLRVLPYSKGSVPPDSLSPQYLFAIQQQKRIALSEALAAFRISPPAVGFRKPFYSSRLIFRCC